MMRELCDRGGNEGRGLLRFGGDPPRRIERHSPGRGGNIALSGVTTAPRKGRRGALLVYPH